MIKKEAYLKLKESFSKVASWAVWEIPTSASPKSNMRSVAMFDSEDILEILNPNYVFIGLNVSGVHDDYMDTSKHWHNFHSSNPYGHDFKLRYALMNTPYWGAYITDAIKELPEVDSNKVSVYLKNNPGMVLKNMEILKREIEVIGGKPTLICMGSKSYQIVKKHLGEQYDVKKITHYSYQIGKEDYRAQVLKSLLCSNDDVVSRFENLSLATDTATISDLKPAVSIKSDGLDLSMPSLEKQLRLTGLDVPENWKGDIRDQLISLFEPVLKGTDYHIEKNLTDTTKNGLNLYFKDDERRCMGFAKTKQMRFLVYPTKVFYEEIQHKTTLPEPNPKKKQPHITLTLTEFWQAFYKITR